MRKPKAPSLAYLEQMTDNVGVIQHARHDVAHRDEGYCLDDNARALLALTYLEEFGVEVEAAARLEPIYASFINGAWNGERRRFRNFMGFDRRWLDEAGSEDSQGRTLHALARARRFGTTPGRRAWADWLFFEALPMTAEFQSPRAVAHAINALVEIDDAAPGRPDIRRKLSELAGWLRSLLLANASPDWYWFEEALAYENALLPAALIAAGVALGDPALRDDGLAALRWIDSLQTAEEGWFRPVGSESFGGKRALPSHFDQQPIEAYATIAACRVAAKAVGGGVWPARAAAVAQWFFGRNDVRAAVYDEGVGACYDGLHRDRPNRNMGAEACLSALMAITLANEMQPCVDGAGSAAHGDERTAAG